MGRVHAVVLLGLVAVVILAWFVYWALRRPGGEVGAGVVDTTAAPAALPESTLVRAAPGSGVVGGPAAPRTLQRVDPEAVIRGDVVYDPRDLEIFRETVRWARAAGVDTLPIGDIIVRVGRRFVGDPYTPHTLDLPGPERLVVNLRTFDCVTYVESMLALARVIRAGRGGPLPTFGAFTDQLRLIRYRNGVIDGYTSRLHYFSEWIRNNQEKGVVENITRALGGIPDTSRIDFMSTHAEAYPQLRGHPERVARIRAIERALSRETRYLIPQSRVGDVTDRMHDGDILAMTSTVPGLDVAHTGFAIRVNGKVYLMNAPLVGKSVEISKLPLAQRILEIPGQNGLMIARPL